MSIEAWRRRIDEIDDELLRLLNRRLESVVQIGHAKAEAGTTITDPDRESAIIDRLLTLNDGPLDEDSIRRVFGTIIAEMRRLESDYAHSGDAGNESR